MVNGTFKAQTSLTSGIYSRILLLDQVYLIQISLSKIVYIQCRAQRAQSLV